MIEKCLAKISSKRFELRSTSTSAKLLSKIFKKGIKIYSPRLLLESIKRIRVRFPAKALVSWEKIGFYR